MRWFSLLLLFVVTEAFSQQSPWKDYQINDKGDTMNRIDIYDRKQGPWVHRYEKVRGEPGYEEEGWYVNNRKDGDWRLFSLSGDLVGVENYKWGFKDGVCKYYTIHGELRLEQSWKALNPDKEYDTLEIEDPDKFDTYRTVIIKNEGAAIKHGAWKYYDPATGALVRTETYTLGKLEGENKTAAAKPADKKAVPKPKEVLDFEKKNKGKKVKYQDGSVGN
jgi:antitoxin component YwqK of YwqJK toxin-antitoxin module